MQTLIRTLIAPDPCGAYGLALVGLLVSVVLLLGWAALMAVLTAMSLRRTS